MASPTRLRLIAFIVAAATPAIATRAGGASLWTITAAGMIVAAALAAFVLWQDEALRDVMVPKGLDVSTGVVVAAALYIGVALSFNLVIAPVSEAGGLLRKCTLTGPRVVRGDAHGALAIFEWVRGQVCRGYAQSLGMLGPWRGVLIVLLAALEETAWRGGIQQELAERLGSTRGWIAASLLYGLVQLGSGSIALALLATACGFAWGGLYRFRGRLAPAIMSHAVFSYFLFHARPLVDFS